MALVLYNGSHSHKPTAIREYFNSIVKHSSKSAPYDEREGFVHTVVESGATGAALGAIHALHKTGLDVSVMGKSIPVDGVAGLIGAFISSKMRGKLGRSVHAVSDRAIAIYAFRGTAKLLAAKSTGLHGEFGSDPLVDAAKDL